MTNLAIPTPPRKQFGVNDPRYVRAVAVIARRHRVTIPHARLISELSGFGGAA